MPRPDWSPQVLIPVDSQPTPTYLTQERSSRWARAGVVTKLRRGDPPKVICPGCKVAMEIRRDQAPVIRLSTWMKTVVYRCLNCGTETERLMAIQRT